MANASAVQKTAFGAGQPLPGVTQLRGSRHAYRVYVRASLDISMPKMNGMQFLEAASVRDNHPNLRIIVFSC